MIALFTAFRPLAETPGVPATEGSGEGGELAYHMAYLQRFADKLHAAGAAENWELADFYLHEVEETAETIIDEGHVEDGVEIGPLVEAMLLPAVERAEGAVGDAAAFAEAYAELVTSCNVCHDATEHGFIRITVPERSGYPNQDFSPLPARTRP